MLWKVTVDNTTELIIESQCAGADDAAMLGNASRAGYGDVSIRVVDDAEHATMLAARDAASMTYADHRRAAYPSIADQLDMQFKDALNGTTVWADTIAAIKAQYPKP